MWVIYRKYNDSCWERLTAYQLLGDAIIATEQRCYLPLNFVESESPLPPSLAQLLYYGRAYDGPRVYVSVYDGRWFYVHQCDEEQEYVKFWVREILPNQLMELECNKISLRDFIFQAKPLYLVYMYNTSTDHPAGPNTLEAFIVNPADFDDSYFPEAGFFLFRNDQ